MRLGKRELQAQFREERIASNPLEISTILVNSFTTSEPPRDTFPLCSEKLTNQ